MPETRTPPHRPLLPDLPIVPVLPDVTGALATEGRAVLVAPPGAGKTTLVPLALLEQPWLGGRSVVVLEPRRLAARAAARRMTSLLGESHVGGTVGYRVRRDTRVGPDTRIEVVTEGVLTRMLLDDPTLGQVGAVIFDEFHERSLNADLGLALTLQARELLRDDLRLLVMSATLAAAPVAELLGGAPVVESRGRSFPVETVFRDRPVEGWLEPAVAGTILQALENEEGDLLAFLPGVSEIRRAAERLREAGLPPATDVLPLYGALSPADQDRAIRTSPPGRRKVVLATSIAETSLTIEGVRVVVDSGRMRVPRFDPGTGLTRLATVTVTRDAADQRRGRAGRTESGVCYRLWTRAEDQGLVPTRQPEVLEADLAPLALELAIWGAAPEELRWMTPPPGAAMAQAVELLQELEALDVAGAATPHGRAMAAFGLHPRLAHMLLRAREMGRGGLACDLAALLGERDVLTGDGPGEDADIRLRLEAVARARESGPGSVRTVRGLTVRGGTLRRVVAESEHLGAKLGVRPALAQDTGSAGVTLALAYPDRVGSRRPEEAGRFLLRNGRGAAFPSQQPLSRSDWIVAASLDGRGRDARIYLAAPVDLGDVEALFASQITSEEGVDWNDEAGRVEARSQDRLGAIVVRQGALPAPDETQVVAALLRGIRLRGLDALPWDRETGWFRERLVFLHALEPAVWPDRSQGALLETLESWLVPWLPPGRPPRRLDELGRVDLREALLTGVPWEARSRMDEWAPSHLEVPSGSRIRIDYGDPEAPALAVKLQEVFGMTETPRIAGGRVPLTMKLLSPAQRPVQVTRDLASFWREGYFQVRRDLRGRYPKHPWPEDPLTAQATRHTKRRS